MTDVLLEMLKVYGLKEVPGEQDNPEIVSMFHTIGYNWVQDDETSWCSASLNYFCFRLGYERSGKLDARSWLTVGEEVTTPQIGDVVVFWRINPQAWQGHVGLYINEDKNYIYVLGGNQKDMMCIIPYPKIQLLGYRRLKKVVYFKSRKQHPISLPMDLPPIRVNIISLWRIYRKFKKWLKQQNTMK